MEQIQRLPEQFSKNGLPYKMIQRNEVVAMFGVGGIYYPDKFHYEVVRIFQVPEKVLFGKTMPAHEAIPGNEQFGREGSKCITDRNQAEAYFDDLTEKLNTSKRPHLDYTLKENSTK